MENNEYLKSLLDREKLTEDSSEISELQKHREKIEKIIRDKFGSSPQIIYGGSKAKHTMIRESYDLDIICSFKFDDISAGRTLKEIRDNIKKILADSYFIDESKKLSLRLKDKENQTDYHIDFIVGRFEDEKEKYENLYWNGPEKDYIRTSPDVQISFIRDSKLNDVIRLVKLWRIKYGLNIKTFILELLVIKILNGVKNKDDFELNLIKFWKDIKDNIKNIAVEDPANPSGNDLSDAFNDSIKDSLSFASENTLESIKNYGWESIFGVAKSLSDKEKISILNQSVQGSTTKIKPWA